MVFNIQPHERKIFNLISDVADDLGFPTYVVGGYVRDRLLARPSKDIDIVCVGSGINLANAIASHLRPRPRVTVYKRFGTAMLKHQDLEIEFVGARKESYRSDSRKPTVEEGTLEDDQNRRDFTINALAVSLNKVDFGHIIDPFNGLQDLEDKVIRTPLEPAKTFSDDPLRMLRGIRFSTQLGFEIAPKTLQAIGEEKHRLPIVSRERISVELNKIILADLPSYGFKLLHQTGLLPTVLPELAAMQGIEEKDGVKHKDNFYHTLKVLDNLARNSNELYLRWSAILHDIGKPATKAFEAGQGWTFHGHEYVGSKMVPRIFRRLRMPTNEKMKYVQKMVLLHQRPIALTKEEITDSAVRRLLFDAGEDIDDLMLLCEADITSKNPQRVQRYLNNYQLLRQRMQEVEEKDQLRNWQPPINGETIMTTFSIPPGREIGIIKNAIREAILEGEIPNEYEAAYAFMLAEGEKLGLKAIV